MEIRNLKIGDKVAVNTLEDLGKVGTVEHVEASEYRRVITPYAVIRYASGIVKAVDLKDLEILG